MDIGKVEKQSSEVEILHPSTLEPTGLVIKVIGYNAPEVKKVIRSLQDARLKRRGRLQTDAEREAEQIKIITASVVGWTWGTDPEGNEATLNGEKPEFSTENVKTVLAEEWLRNQVDDANMDERRFFTN